MEKSLQARIDDLDVEDRTLFDAVFPVLLFIFLFCIFGFFMIPVWIVWYRTRDVRKTRRMAIWMSILWLIVAIGGIALGIA